jgi:hypothetical protein
MWVVIVGFGSFLIIFSLLMFIVHITRPRIFKLKATVTKWISLDIEMEEPKCEQKYRPDDEKP